jgi:hypothetical protein
MEGDVFGVLQQWIVWFTGDSTAVIQCRYKFVINYLESTGGYFKFT